MKHPAARAFDERGGFTVAVSSGVATPRTITEVHDGHRPDWLLRMASKRFGKRSNDNAGVFIH